jgi:CubicO group peptidase (beta-lactamase class C family)
MEAVVGSAALPDGFSGVAAIARNGQVLLRQARGVADRRTGLQNSPSTKFVVASVTQTFTAVAAYQLVQAGRLGLDAPLSSILPEFVGKDAGAATVRQLLSHTAGIGGTVTTEAFRRSPERFRDLDDYLKLVTAEPLTAKPGTEYRYTDGDSVILGAIIERVTGRSYYDYVEARVFRPAGMTNSGFVLSPRPTNLAVGYTARARDGSRQAALHENSLMLPVKASPGTAAYSTADDLIRFGSALLQGRLLPQEATTELLEGQVPTGDARPREHYGFGFFEGNSENIRIVNHGGTGPGIDVAFDLYPELGFVVVVLSNQDPPSAQRIRDAVRQKISGLTFMPSRGA